MRNVAELRWVLDRSLDPATEASMLLKRTEPGVDALTTLSAHLSKLSDGVALVDEALNQQVWSRVRARARLTDAHNLFQVSSNHESLLRQVSHIKELEGTLGVVNVGVVALQQSIDRCDVDQTSNVCLFA